MYKATEYKHERNVEKNRIFVETIEQFRVIPGLQRSINPTRQKV